MRWTCILTKITPITLSRLKIITSASSIEMRHRACSSYIITIPIIQGTCKIKIF